MAKLTEADQKLAVVHCNQITQQTSAALLNYCREHGDEFSHPAVVADIAIRGALSAAVSLFRTVEMMGFTQFNLAVLHSMLDDVAGLELRYVEVDRNGGVHPMGRTN